MGDLFVRILIAGLLTVLVGSMLAGFLGVNRFLAYGLGLLVGVLGASRSGVR